MKSIQSMNITSNKEQFLNLLISMNKKLVKEKLENYGIEEYLDNDITSQIKQEIIQSSFKYSSQKSFSVYNFKNKKEVNHFRDKLRRKLDIKG